MRSNGREFHQDDKGREISLLRGSSLFTRSLVNLALFLAISILALNGFEFIPPLPSQVRNIMGPAPSPQLISSVLMIYAFSAIVLVLCRMMTGSAKRGGASHVAFLSGFYLFYRASGSLTSNFWAVFAAGMTILLLESYHLWVICSENHRPQ